MIRHHNINRLFIFHPSISMEMIMRNGAHSILFDTPARSRCSPFYDAPHSMMRPILPLLICVRRVARGERGLGKVACY